MAFHDVRFPELIGRGARGGPERRTQVVALSTGFEERNASWFASRRSFDIGYGVRSADRLAEVVAFFEARNGRLHAFRFRDWSDYKSCPPSATPAADDQAIGTGDGATSAFQLSKLYASGAQTYSRTITKPVSGTVLAALDGTPTTAFSVDLLTGIITFDAAPSNGADVTAGFEFDVPVRFDSDRIDVDLDFERLGSIPSIPLIEVRE